KFQKIFESSNLTLTASPMAHIERFKVTGLAGRKDSFSKELNTDTNVFFGANGSGKTSLLRILHSAISGDTSSLNTIPFHTAEVDIYSVDYKQTFTRTIERGRSIPRNSDSDERILVEPDRFQRRGSGYK